MVFDKLVQISVFGCAYGNNAHKKLAWCTERRDRVIDFWVAFSEVVIIVRRLIREGWSRYRWEGRPRRRP
jgi:hypothetical protein